MMFKAIRSIICWVLLVVGMFMLTACIFDLARVGWNFQAYGSANVNLGLDFIGNGFIEDYIACSLIMILGCIINVGVMHYTSDWDAIIMISLEIIITPIMAAYLIIYKIIGFFKWIIHRND